MKMLQTYDYDPEQSVYLVIQEQEPIQGGVFCIQYKTSHLIY